MVCDVCNAAVTPNTCYLLTTAQVVRERRYWDKALSDFVGLYRQFDPTGPIDPSTVTDQVRHAAGQRTAWAVCEDCAGLFEFDRETARGYAARQEQPPGCGPVNPREAERVAMGVWQTTFAQRPAARRPAAPANARQTAYSLPSTGEVTRDGWFSRLWSRLRGF
jgi:hypothetical protein